MNRFVTIATSDVDESIQYEMLATLRILQRYYYNAPVLM